ncbi:unnamed protein product [Auanema sp. JU1783]|nr:unnamed protein product [Auanema sp. JU1783]
MRRSSRSPSLERILERRPSFDRPPVRTVNSPRLTENEALMLTSPFLGYRTRYTYAKSSCYNAEETDAWEIPNLANNLEIEEEFTRANMKTPTRTTPIFRKLFNFLCTVLGVVGRLGRTCYEEVFIDIPLKFISVVRDIAEAIYTPIGVSVSLLSHGIKSLTFVLGKAVVDLVRAIKNFAVYQTIRIKDTLSSYSWSGFTGLRSLLLTAITSSVSRTSSISRSFVSIGAELLKELAHKAINFFSALWQLFASAVRAVFRGIVWTLGKLKMGICTIHDALIKPKRVSISEVSQTLAFDIDSTPMSIIKGDAELCATTPVSREPNVAGRRLLRSRRVEVDSDDSISDQFLTSTPLPQDERSNGQYRKNWFYYPAYIIGIFAFAFLEAIKGVSQVVLYVLSNIQRLMANVWNLMKASSISLFSAIGKLFNSFMGATSSAATQMNNGKFWLFFLLILLLALLIPVLPPQNEEHLLDETTKQVPVKQEEIITGPSFTVMETIQIIFEESLFQCSLFKEHCSKHYYRPFLLFLSGLSENFFSQCSYFTEIQLREYLYSGLLYVLDFFLLILMKGQAFAVYLFTSTPSKPVEPIIVRNEFFSDDRAAIIQKVKADLQAEIDQKLESFKSSYEDELESLKKMKGVSQNDFAQLSAFVRQLIYQYDVDKTGLFDYALESAGASVLSTRCSENYESYSRLEKIWNIPLWFTSYGPRTVIQRNSNSLFPGECWCFKSGKGYLTISLSHAISISSISYEHIAKSQTPDGQLTSAPKKLKFWAYKSENDLESRVLLGEFEYDTEEQALQFFIIKEKPNFPVKIVELETEENYGADYTCLYRLRVHGQIPKD